MKRRQFVTALTTGAVCLGAQTGWAQPSRLPLFRIERNKNKNVVHYDLRLNAAGRPREQEPMDVYWRMHEENGQREELTLLERSMAYGCTVRERPRETELVIALAAFDSRLIRVRADHGQAQALVQIAGHGAVLKHIFVQAGDGLVPSVDYVELAGTRADGTAVQERVRGH